MSFLRKLVRAFTSEQRWGDIEAESRAWIIQCPSCGWEQSVWEAGGMRYGASGNRRTYMKCPKCGKRGWHRFYKKTEAEPQGAKRAE